MCRITSRAAFEKSHFSQQPPDQTLFTSFHVPEPRLQNLKPPRVVRVLRHYEVRTQHLIDKLLYGRFLCCHFGAHPFTLNFAGTLASWLELTIYHQKNQPSTWLGTSPRLASERKNLPRRINKRDDMVESGYGRKDSRKNKRWKNRPAFFIRQRKLFAFDATLRTETLTLYLSDY